VSTVEPKTQPGSARWLELFLDLVFIAALALLNNVVLTNPTTALMIESAVATGALLTIWLTLTLMNQWFPADDAWRRGATLVVMAGLMLAALSVDPVVGLGYQVGQFAYAAVLLALSSIFVRALGDASAPRRSLMAAIAVAWTGAALSIVAGSIDASAEVEYGFVLVTTLLLLIPLNAIYVNGGEAERVLGADHLTERLSMLPLIMLGEGFALMAVNLQHPEASPDLPFFLLAFVVAFLLWRLFFDGVLRRKGGFVYWRAAFIGQYLLMLGILWLFDVLSLLSARTEGAIGSWDTAQFALAATITFLGFAVLTFAQGPPVGLATWLHLIVAAANLALVVIVVAFGGGLRVMAVAVAVLVAVDAFVLGRLAAPSTRDEVAHPT
jgi:low temperature requirement protein LtrA